MVQSLGYGQLRSRTACAFGSWSLGHQAIVNRAFWSALGKCSSSPNTCSPSPISNYTTKTTNKPNVPTRQTPQLGICIFFRSLGLRSLDQLKFTPVFLFGICLTSVLILPICLRNEATVYKLLWLQCLGKAVVTVLDSCDRILWSVCRTTSKHLFWISHIEEEISTCIC